MIWAWHLSPVKPEGRCRRSWGPWERGCQGSWEGWEERCGSCLHSGRAGHPGRGQETGMSHPGSQGHTWEGWREESSHPDPLLLPTYLLCLPFVSLHLLRLLPFSPFSPSLPCSPSPSHSRGALTGRSLAPGIGSGRCLRWHRVLGNSHTAALGMEMRVDRSREHHDSHLPSFGCSGGTCLQQPTKVLHTTIASTRPCSSPHWHSHPSPLDPRSLSN